MRLNYAAGTHKGLTRHNNQDAFLCRPEKGIFAVADGLGGHQAGEVASRLVLKVLDHHLSRLPVYNSRAGWLKTSVYNKDEANKTARAWLTGAFKDAGQAIKDCAKTKPDFTGLGSTLTTLALEGRSALIAHLGDSRAYLFREAALYQLSKDHNLAGELLAEGVLSPEEISSSLSASVLTRALCDAEGADFSPDISRHAFLANDIFMLCTDGLYGPLGNDLIKRLLIRKDPLERMVKNMIKTANALGGPDNISVLLVRVED